MGWLNGLLLVLAVFLALAQDDGGRDPRVLIGSVGFTSAEVEAILALSPLPAPPPDPTNRWADDPAAARLGQALFFDQRLSADGSVSCATCHDPSKSWTDGKVRGMGLEEVRRNTMTLWNVAHNRWFYWDGRRDTLWAQALTPIEAPQEHGFSRNGVVHLLASDPGYRRAYGEVFGELPDVSDATRFPAAARPVFDDAENAEGAAWRSMSDADREAVDRVFANVGKAIAAYERYILTQEAPFDAYARGLRENRAYEQRAITDAAKRGLRLFLDRARCHFCHFGPNFTDREFHDTRLPLEDPDGDPDLGRYTGIQELHLDPFKGNGLFSDAPEDAEVDAKLNYLVLNNHNVREFKTPTLRNVRFTGPYMHDGRFQTLEEVIDFYDTLEGAAARKMGEKLLVPLNLDDREKADLLDFLGSLSSTSLPRELTQAPPTPYLPDDER